MIVSAAVIPSNTGISRSRRTTSGFFFLQSSTASNPSGALRYYLII